jgi:hypothetical protein
MELERGLALGVSIAQVWHNMLYIKGQENPSLELLQPNM